MKMITITESEYNAMKKLAQMVLNSCNKREVSEGPLEAPQKLTNRQIEKMRTEAIQKYAIEKRREFYLKKGVKVPL